MMKVWPLLIVLVSYSAHAQMYFLGQGGYARLNQEAAVENNVRPVGLTYGAGVGFREDFYELEASLQKMSLAADIDHDSTVNTLKHEDTTFTLAFNFYLSKRLYLRLGYAFHRIDQTLENEVSDASLEGARKAYGMQEGAAIDGMTFGGGYVIYDGNKLSVFTQFETMSMSAADANVMNIALGFRFYTR